MASYCKNMTQSLCHEYDGFKTCMHSKLLQLCPNSLQPYEL